MITPNIAPRKITGSAAAGLFSAAKSSIRRMEKTTDALSKAPNVTKEQKLGINYVQFFGSKKNAKILKKSLKSIRDSLVATFAIAKLLRSEVSKNVKLIGEKTKGKRGFFGLGLGGILGIINLLTNPIVLTVLGIGAGTAGIGFLGAFLYSNRDKIIEFIMDKSKGLYDFLMNFVSNVVGDFVGDRVKSPELRNVEIESEENIEKDKIKLMKGEDGLSANEAQFQAVQNETANLQNQISKLQSKDVKTTKEKDKLKALKTRLKELTTGEVTTDLLTKKIFGLDIPNPTDAMFGNQIRQSLRKEPVFPLKEYASQSNAEKLKTIQAITSKFQRQGNSLDTIKQVYGRALKTNKIFTKDGKERELTNDQRIFANDMFRLADQLQAGGNSSSAVDPKTFTPSNVNTKIPSSISDGGKVSSSDTTGVGGDKISTVPTSGGGDLVANASPASSSPSFNDHINFNPDNDFVEFNASMLNIFA